MHVREAADARAPLAVGVEPGLLGDLVERDSGQPEDRAAGAVEVAGRRAEQVDQERDERAEATEAGAGAAVHGGAVGCGEVAGQRADDVSRHAAYAPRSPRAGRHATASRQLAQPSVWRASAASSASALLDEHAQQREQQPGVGVGADRDVLEVLRGLGAARVDDDDAAAALDDVVQLLLDLRRGQHAAVRDERVRTEHQQEARALEVRDREQRRRAVEEVRWRRSGSRRPARRPCSSAASRARRRIPWPKACASS